MHLDFIYNRHSIRHFKTTQIPLEDVYQILDAATHAPSAKNVQNWHFVVIRNKATILEIANLVEKKHIEIARLSSTEKTKDYFMRFLKYYTAFKNAPTLILVYAGPYPMLEMDILNENHINNSTLESLIKSNPGIQNIGAALQNLMLAATHLGYGTCWMTGPTYASHEIQALVNLEKEGYDLVALTPIGIPDEPITTVPRKPLEEVVTIME